MSLDQERQAIEAYFLSRWSGATPVGTDGHAFSPVDGSVQLTLTSGAVRQGSIGRTLNRIDNLGLVTATLYTGGGAGSASWRRSAEDVIDLFFEVTLDHAGEPIAAGASPFIRFSPPEMGDNRHPHVAASFVEAPFRRTNVVAPFIRYSFR